MSKTYHVAATFASGKTYTKTVRAVSALDAKNAASHKFAAREPRLIPCPVTGGLTANGIITITANKEE
jgi:hypothetical protein